jgi:hypothetical protein
LRYYTRTYRNGGVHSTQRNEGYHVVTKKPLTKHLQLHKAVEYLVADLDSLLSVHYSVVNRQRKFRPRLLDLNAFSEVADLLTHYCLDLVMTEWSNTKIMGLAVEEGKEEAVDFNPESGSACPLACELPLRYGLPCKHWMYPAFLRGCQLPLSLFHPRWLFDGPPVLHEVWKMLWCNHSEKAPSPTRDLDASRSRFHGHGEEMVKGAAMEAVLLLRKCPPSLAENYAVAVRDMNAVLLEKQQQLLARAEQAPLELPPPLPQPNARDFPTSRKRKMTGLEAALQEEVDAAARRRREAIEAQAEYDDRLRYTQESVRGIIERHSQQDEPSPSYQPLLPSPSSNMPSPSSSNEGPSSSSSSSDNSGDDSENGGETAENLRPRRGVRRSRKLVENSQARKDIAALKAPKRRKPGKKAMQAAAEMSQLLDGYVPPPSSAVILNS